MNRIRKVYLHNDCGAQKLDLPEGFVILSASYSRNRSIIVHYEGDDDYPVNTIEFYVLDVGDVVHPMGKHVAIAADKQSMQHIYQIIEDAMPLQ